MCSVRVVSKELDMTKRLNWADSICYLNVTEKTNEILSVTYSCMHILGQLLVLSLVCSFCLWIFWVFFFFYFLKKIIIFKNHLIIFYSARSSVLVRLFTSGSEQGLLFVLVLGFLIVVMVSMVFCFFVSAYY